MRKIAILLTLVGSFLIVTAMLFAWYAPGKVKKTPLDTNTTTYLTGEAEVGSEPAVPVNYTSITKANSDKSDGDVIVFQTATCLVKAEGDPPPCVSADDPDERLINAGEDTFATDRRTAVAVNDDKYLPGDAVEHLGLVNKWPFDAEKRDYGYWDGTAGQEVEAKYDGTEKIDGFETYRFKVAVDEVAIDDVGGGTPGTYSSDTTLWIDPVTGSIIKQAVGQERLTEAGDNVLSLTIEYTADQVKKNVDEAEANGSKLSLLSKTVPIIGFVIGIPALLAGLFLSLRGGGSGGARARTEG